MEAVMGGDKASQERLQARADAAEAERRAVRDEAANQIDVMFSSTIKCIRIICGFILQIKIWKV